MRRPRIPFGAALALALAAGLAALAASDPARPATPWYQVEVVIFAQGGESPWDRDDWREEGPPPLPENTVELLPGLPLVGEAKGSNRRHAFRSLPASKLELTAAADRLDRAADYRVLLHVGWRQPGSRRDDAPAVHLDTLRGLSPGARFAAAPGEAVDGTIRLWRRRFLHVDTDLAFGDVEAWRGRKDAGADAEPGNEHREAAPAAGVASNPDTGEGAVAGAAELGAPGPTGRKETEATTEPRPAGGEPRRAARIARSLRVRAGKPHYIDHPLFGVLLKVSRLR